MGPDVDNQQYISVRTLEHPEIPEVKGSVRAEIVIAGWHFKKIEESLIQATYISCVITSIRATSKAVSRLHFKNKRKRTRAWFLII